MLLSKFVNFCISFAYIYVGHTNYLDDLGIGTGYCTSGMCAPQKERTKEDYANLFNTINEHGCRGTELRFIPEEFVTEEMCLESVKDSGFNLKDVPNKFKTKIVCVTAVGKQPSMLRYVPIKQKTWEICCMAVCASYDVMIYVPDEFKKKLGHIASIAHRKHVRTRGGVSYPQLDQVPIWDMTQKICEYAVFYDRLSLKVVPMWYMSKKICDRVLADL